MELRIKIGAIGKLSRRALRAFLDAHGSIFLDTHRIVKTISRGTSNN